MKKKCPECGRTFEKSEYKGCPICMEPLIDIAERTELPKGRKYEVFEGMNFVVNSVEPVEKMGWN